MIDFKTQQLTQSKTRTQNDTKKTPRQVDGVAVSSHTLRHLHRCSAREILLHLRVELRGSLVLQPLLWLSGLLLHALLLQPPRPLLCSFPGLERGGWRQNGLYIALLAVSKTRRALVKVVRRER